MASIVVISAGSPATYGGNVGYTSSVSRLVRTIMFESIGLPELLVILGVAVLLFGGKKIPEVAKGLGEGIRNFKNAMKAEPEKEAEKAIDKA